ncbi:MAG: sulfotransferase family 2 domain-containing protein [Desulforhopalus sp.]
MMEPIVFIHVPKTAGTSFRYGADQFFGALQVCRDYGPKSPETSDIVNHLINQNADWWQFRRAFDEHNYRFFTGHFNAKRYASLFGIARTITFLRDPVQRIVSEYNHFVRNYNYQRSLKEFYNTKNFINRQLGMFIGIPWSGLGFIGFTERYAESLTLLNTRFQIDIPCLKANISKESISQNYILSQEQKTEICHLNAAEIKFYDRARTQYEWRVKLAKTKQKFVKGMINGVNDNHLKGWAIYDDQDKPVQLQIALNGEQIGDVVACEDRPNLRGIGIGRGGFVGFSLKIPAVRSGDEISVIAVSTGQPLANSPWRMISKN